MSSYQRWLALGLVVVAFVSFSRFPAAPPTPPPPATLEPLGDRPKLVVLVVFDQLRGDYLQKWQPLFGEGGFKRLQSEGAWFTNCHYPYAYTLTAPGHTSLVTGTYPARHGIIANDWYDRANKMTVASVTPLPTAAREGLNPLRRKSKSVGDSLMEKMGPRRARVASLSIKDRAAILMAAMRAQICYWFNLDRGEFVTSQWYRRDEKGRELRDDVHKWVKAFNASGKADQWMNKDWVKLHPNLDYAKHSGPDEVEEEGWGYHQGQTFPHPTPYEPGAPNAKKHYLEAVDTSPYGNDLLLDLAKTAITAEKLGQSNSVDLLCLSFSSNDLVGHCWGPDSQEVLDITLRSDLIVKDLLDFLDAKVGRGNYVIALSADHGVCPLTSVAAKQGHPSGRVPNEVLTSLAEDFLNKTFLKDGQKLSWFEVPNKYNAWVYLNPRVIKDLKLDQSDVERSLAKWYSVQPGIKGAYTRTELLVPERSDDPEELKMMRRSFTPESSGDVMVVLEPYHLFSPATLSKDPAKGAAYRTTHGTPHPYDTHVPLLVMGPRINPGERGDRITPQAMAAILSEALRVDPPNAEYPTPPGLFRP